MNAVTFTFLLTMMAAMTSAEVDDLTNFLHLPPHKEHLYFLDVISDNDVDDLKAELENFTIDYSFQVVGEPRFFFVLKSNDTSALRHLTFPSGSLVTQYPVERFREYVQMILGIPAWNVPHFVPSPNKTYLYGDWTADIPKDVCPETFKLEIQSWLDMFSGVDHSTQPVCFPLIATYPFRCLAFLEVEENVQQNVLRIGAANFGGYGASKIQMIAIVTV